MKTIKGKIILVTFVLLFITFAAVNFEVSNISEKAIMKKVDENSLDTIDQVYDTIESYSAFVKRIREAKEEDVKIRLKELTETAENILLFYYDEYKKGNLSEEEAKEKAKENIRKLRYGKDGYFWIDNDKYILQVLPTAPEKEGMDRENLKDINGKALVKELVDGAVKNGETYVKYWFTRFGNTEASPKIGYTRYFKPWGWIIGTGEYIDNIDEEMKKLEKENFENLNNNLYANKEKSSYPFAIGANGELVLHKDKNLIGEKPKDVKNGKSILDILKENKNGKATYYFSKNGKGIYKKIAYVRYNEDLKWWIVYSEYESEILKTTNQIKISIMLFSVLAFILIAFVLNFAITKLLKNIPVITQILKDLSNGIIKGELEVKTKDEIGQMAIAFNEFIKKQKSIILEIQEGADLIEISAKEINYANENLAKKAASQASSLEETSATMEEISSIITNNTESIVQVKGLSEEAKDRTYKLAETSGDLKESMQSILESSNKVKNIIDVIDEIAFQTNLLALNAAVEAARAGESGRGFAVVAQEVRNLAGRSSRAAKEIKELINENVQRTELGDKLIDNTVMNLNEVFEGVKKVTYLIENIAESATEQQKGVEQVNKAVIELDEITQTNAGIAEETSAGTEILHHKAVAFNEAIRFFKIEKDEESFKNLKEYK